MKFSEKRKRGGFTMVEMMITTLILGLVTMIAAQGSSSVARVYTKALSLSDSQMLLTEMENQIRNDLTFTTRIKGTDNSGVVTVTDYECVYWTKIEAIPNSGGKVTLYRTYEGYSSKDPIAPKSAKRLEAYTATAPTIQYDTDSNIFTVTGLKVTCDTGAEAGPVNMTVSPVNSVEVVS